MLQNEATYHGIAGLVPVTEGGGNYSITSSSWGIIDSLIGEFLAATLSPAVSLDKRLAGFQLGEQQQEQASTEHTDLTQPGTTGEGGRWAEATTGLLRSGQVTTVFAPARAIPCRH